MNKYKEPSRPWYSVMLSGSACLPLTRSERKKKVSPPMLRRRTYFVHSDKSADTFAFKLHITT